MTFPAITDAAGSTLTAVAALMAAAALSWFGGSLLQVSVLSCAVVFVLDKFIL